MPECECLKQYKKAISNQVLNKKRLNDYPFME